MNDRPAIVLVQPRIPQNVGAIARVCAATRASLHIVRPIPFEMNDRSLRRSGMDYLELLELHVHLNWEACQNALPGRRFWFLSSHGKSNVYTTEFQLNDVLVFGSEEAGLPDEIWETIENRDLKLPMPEPKARCLNLATSAAIVLYEALRQNGELSSI